MKRFSILGILALTFVLPSVVAQNHGELGVFGNVTRLQHAGPTNFVGLGGRISFNVSENAQIEAEMAYDFERTVSSTLTVGNVTSTERSGLRLLHGLFGPKFQTGGGAIRAFVTAKGGFLNFSVSSPTTAASTAFRNTFSNVLDGDTNGVFYPGAGVEAYLGPIGVRFDIGDMIYFENGANHNLKISFGPHIRF